MHYRQRPDKPVATCSIMYADAKFNISEQILALGSIGTRWKEGRSAGRGASVPCSCSCSNSSFQLLANRKTRQPVWAGSTFCIWSFPFERKLGDVFLDDKRRH